MSTPIITWCPFEELSCDKTNNFAVLILNTPIGFQHNPNFILNIWNKGTSFTENRNTCFPLQIL